MSGFDVTMRSQQQVNQSQQFYDSQRYQMMGQMGQAIGQAPAMLQEIAVRQQDADMRLALQQQEFQSNAMKLQAMTAIDQADLMREQVRGAKLQNDAMEFDMRQRQEQMGMQKEQMHSVRVERMVQALGGGRGMLAAGVKFDPQTQSFGVMTDEEKKAAAKDVGATEFNSRRNYLQQAYRMAMDQGNEDEAAQLYEEYRALGGAQPAAPRQPKATPAQPMDNATTERVRRLSTPTSVPDIVGHLARGGDPTMFGGFKPEVAQTATSWLTQNKQSIHDYMRKLKDPDGRSYAGETPDVTIDRLIDELRDPGSPFRTNILQLLVRNGVITMEQAQSAIGQ